MQTDHQLIQRLGSVVEAERKSAVYDLLDEGEVALPVVSELIYHHDPKVRASACEVLGGIHVEDSESIRLLVQTLDDEFDNVRRAAASALAQYGAKICVLLVTELFNPNPRIQCMAALVFELLAPKSLTKSVVSKLIDLLNHHDASVRNQAARTLSKIPEQMLDQIFSALDNAISSNCNNSACGLIKALRDHDSRSLKTFTALVTVIDCGTPRMFNESMNAIKFKYPEFIKSLGTASVTLEIPKDVANFIRENKPEHRLNLFERIILELGITDGAYTRKIPLK